MKIKTLLFIQSLLFVVVQSTAQVTITGTVTDMDGKPMFGVIVYVDQLDERRMTNEDGVYNIAGVSAGIKKLIFFQPGFKKEERMVDLKSGVNRLNLKLKPLSKELEGVTVSGNTDNGNVMTTLKPVEGMAIYAGRKTEVVQLKNITANLASNRARQIFAQVAGLNIWESDCAGIQIGVGGRGLSPSRMENFNTRQNGYDIAADALGYPESYYSPPMQAIEKIEVVRGAASLQYGPQFGGMLNFVMKEGSKEKKIEVETLQSAGSYGFYNNYTAVGGTIGRFNYYSYFHYKLGDCWRCNSDFDNYNVYGGLRYTSKKGTSIKLEYTRMWYLARQAGGLTDFQFNEDPKASFRNRNWFRVKWNVMSLSLQHEFSSTTKVDARLFGLIGSREALGFQGPPSQTDPIDDISVTDLGRYRNLIDGRFNNIGGEFRLLHRYQIRNQPQVFLTGVRLYRGYTESRQGAADSTSGPVFEFADVVANGASSLHPSVNVAWFAENIFNIHKKVSITPGVRVEYIDTRTEGSTRQIIRDQPGNVLLDSLRTGVTTSRRWFPLFGLGVSYKPLIGLEVYGNFSQNYKPINFNDLWVTTTSARIDPNMKDETGFNADLGLRGRIKDAFQFDVTGFLMMYNNRIGYVQEVDSVLFSVYRLRTNISNARTVGVETYLRWNAIKTFLPNSDWKLGVFSNVTWLDARYVASNETAFQNKQVELTPALMVRTGFDLSWKDMKMSYLLSFTDNQFTDATNSVQTNSGVNGVIPSFYVMDLNVSYKIWKCNMTVGIENITDNKYFTRRATGYPGPGIIPSSGRTFFVTVGIKI